MLNTPDHLLSVFWHSFSQITFSSLFISRALAQVFCTLLMNCLPIRSEFSCCDCARGYLCLVLCSFSSYQAHRIFCNIFCLLFGLRFIALRGLLPADRSTLGKADCGFSTGMPIRRPSSQKLAE